MENSDYVNNDDETKLKENDQNVDASEKNDEDVATTSRARPLVQNPEYKSDNMNDLKLIGINSADTVRQAMKAILSSKAPPLSSPNFRQVQINPEHNCTLLSADQDVPTLTLKVDEPQVRQYMAEKKQKAKVGKQNQLRIKERTERKRKQPRQESSNRRRKAKISSMYVGKLSNVMTFKRYKRIKSESDMDSVVLFY